MPRSRDRAAGPVRADRRATSSPRTSRDRRAASPARAMLSSRGLPRGWRGRRERNGETASGLQMRRKYIDSRVRRSRGSRGRGQRKRWLPPSSADRAEEPSSIAQIVDAASILQTCLNRLSGIPAKSENAETRLNSRILGSTVIEASFLLFESIVRLRYTRRAHGASEWGVGARPGGSSSRSPPYTTRRKARPMEMQPNPGARARRVQRNAGTAAHAGTGGTAVESRAAGVRRSADPAGGVVVPALVGRKRRASCVNSRQAASPSEAALLQKRSPPLQSHIVCSSQPEAGNWKLSLKPVSQLEHQHVVCRRGERAAEIPSELKLAGIGIVLALLGPDHVDRRSRPPLPSKDRIQAQRLEVEVGVVELE